MVVVLLSLRVFVLVVVVVVVDVCCFVDLYLLFGQHQPKKEQPKNNKNPLFYSPILKGSSGTTKRPTAIQIGFRGSEILTKLCLKY